MILKRAVKEFLSRPRDDFRKWKDYSSDKLWSLYDDLEVDPPIFKKLRKHQRTCFLIGAKLRRFAFHLDTGSGKTLLSIALVRYFRRAGVVNRCLVLVPNRINLPEWRREVTKHSPATSMQALTGSSEDKWRQLEEGDALINVVTYMGLVRMVCDLTTIKRKRKKVNKLQPNAKSIARLVKLVDGCILDESTQIQNHQSLPFRICRQLAKSVNIWFELSGTPFGRDPQAMWAQMFLVDWGETLGPTLGLFRAVFYDSKPGFWGGSEYTFKKPMQGELNRVLAHRSIRYEADEADLPRLVPIIREVDLPADADVYQQKLRDQMKASRGNYVEMKNSFMRLRQLSSGFIGFKDDDTGDRVQFEFETNPKLEALLDIVLSIREDYKIVVAYDFVHSGRVISKALKEEGIKHVLVSGKTKDPDAALDKFVNDPKCQVLAMNSVGAYGLNLQMARYIIFYESPVPIIIRKQMRRRVERQGSKYKTVFMYDLVTRRTYDSKILEFHAQGRELFKAIIDGEPDGLI